MILQANLEFHNILYMVKEKKLINVMKLYIKKCNKNLK